MSSVQTINPDAEVVAKSQALLLNITAARGLQKVMTSNLGPRGTLKMLVGGAGQIKLTKDGKVLLYEMQIQHPTAAMIARTATAQDEITGDGTTSVVLLCGEMLKQAERFLAEGTHPRTLADGYDLAREWTLNFLDEFKEERPQIADDRELLASVARCALRTKLQQDIADQMTDAVTDAVLCVRDNEDPTANIDLHMVEIMTMQHEYASDSRLVQGIVCDHGTRHPDMPKRMENCFVMTLNVTLEYERTEISSGFYYSNAEEREKLVESERAFVDDKVRKIIAFKREVCQNGESFFICNQKGIDPMALDMLAKEGIMALRRAKRRNMERVTLACGGMPINSVDDELTADMLGWCDKVTEEKLGEDMYTFIEGVRNSKSCTILVKGPNAHTIEQIKDSLRDGLRAVKNCIEDACVVAGAGAFEMAAHCGLMEYKNTVQGRAKLGVQAYADALLVIPKSLAENSGLDTQDAILALEEEYKRNLQAGNGVAVGLDLDSGEPLLPAQEGIWDCFRVKRQMLHLSTVLSTQLLMVDEVMRAGKQMGKAPQGVDDHAMG